MLKSGTYAHLQLKQSFERTPITTIIDQWFISILYSIEWIYYFQIHSLNQMKEKNDEVYYYYYLE